MPFPSIEKLAEFIPDAVRNWGRQFTAQLVAWLNIEHHDDGSHSDVTADTIESGPIYLTFPSSPNRIKFYAASDTVAQLQQGDDGALASLEVNNLNAAVVNLTELMQVTAAAPEIRWYEGDASTDNHYWRAIADGEVWRLQSMTDAFAVSATALSVSRSGAVTVPSLSATSIASTSTVAAATAVVIGSADATGIRLDLDAPARLAIRLGDDSAFGSFVFDSYAGTAGLLSTALIIGSPDTAGVRLHVNSGVLEVREGDDSELEAINCRYVAAFTGVLVGNGSVGSPSVAAIANQNTGLYWPTTDTLAMTVGGSNGFTFSPVGGGTGFTLTIEGGAFGTGAVRGSRLSIERNTSGTGAPGLLLMQRKSGTTDTIWVDDIGDVRIGNGPTEDGTVSDTSGTVIGTQTSTRAEKIILGERFDYETSLQHVLEAPVFDWKYRNGRFNGEIFTGTTTDDAPIFGMDEGKSLNVISAIGHLMQSIKAQQKQIEKLERELNALKEKRVE